MSAAVTEILHDAYMGRLTGIRTLQLLAGMDNLTGAKRFCVLSHTFHRWRSDGRQNPSAVHFRVLVISCRGFAGRAVTAAIAFCRMVGNRCGGTRTG